jgi:hypothetical protein
LTAERDTERLEAYDGKTAHKIIARKVPQILKRSTKPPKIAFPLFEHNLVQKCVTTRHQSERPLPGIKQKDQKNDIINCDLKIYIFFGKANGKIKF